MSESIVIVGAKRTPIGAMQGKFNNLSAHQLGAVAIKAALEQAGVGPGDVDDLIMGCVLSAGQGQAPARADPRFGKKPLVVDRESLPLRVAIRRKS